MDGGRENISEIRHNNCCVKRKLTGVVDAFLREACDRIETHNQYEVIRIPCKEKCAAERRHAIEMRFELQALLAFLPNTGRS